MLKRLLARDAGQSLDLSLAGQADYRSMHEGGGVLISDPGGSDIGTPAFSYQSAGTAPHLQTNDGVAWQVRPASETASTETAALDPVASRRRSSVAVEIGITRSPCRQMYLAM